MDGDPRLAVVAHATERFSRSQVVGRQVGWSVMGHWCVVVGSHGLAAILRRWDGPVGAPPGPPPLPPPLSSISKGKQELGPSAGSAVAGAAGPSGPASHGQPTRAVATEDSMEVDQEGPSK